jgi:hypothetical protein
MRRTTIFMTCLLAAGLARAATTTGKPLKGDDISDMLITGENRLRVSAPAVETSWSPDVYRDISPALREETLIASLKSPAVSEPPLTFPSKTSSAKTASPWLHSVLQAPILTMEIKPAKEQKKVDWVFLVKDSNGQTFFERRENGALPDKIEWDGFGKSGVPMAVGHDYAYSLSIVDEAGNPQRVSGKPFAVPAFRYARAGRVVTAVMPTLLFDEEASARLSGEGRRVLTEIKDTLRTQFNRKIEVVVYEPDPKFALARSNAVAQQLTQALEYEDGRVEAKAGTLKGEEGYRHVEIIAK